MKRKFLCVVLCLLITLGCFAFDVFAEKVDSKDIDWGLTLMVDELTPTGMVLVQKQFGGQFRGQLEYCCCYSLEVLQGNEWVPIPHIGSSVCGLDPDSVIPNAITREQINWKRDYGELTTGHYRYIREFEELISDDPTSGDAADFCVEFVITDPHTCRSDKQGQICDICLAIMPHICTDGDGDSSCNICGKSIDVFRVVGNADWLGSWDPDNDLGIMTEEKPGFYTKDFQNVPPGSYELKITKNGRWDEAYGSNGLNYTFTVVAESDITVAFRRKDDHAVIEVYGQAGWPDEDDEENPKSSDFTSLPAVLLLISAATMTLLLHKREDAL